MHDFLPTPTPPLTSAVCVKEQTVVSELWWGPPTLFWVCPLPPTLYSSFPFREAWQSAAMLVGTHISSDRNPFSICLGKLKFRGNFLVAYWVHHEIQVVLTLWGPGALQCLGAPRNVSRSPSKYLLDSLAANWLPIMGRALSFWYKSRFQLVCK